MDEREHQAGGLVALLDQVDAGLRDVAGLLGGYRRSLIEMGFAPDDALELCLDVQRAVIFGDIGHAPLD